MSAPPPVLSNALWRHMDHTVVAPSSYVSNSAMAPALSGSGGHGGGALEPADAEERDLEAAKLGSYRAFQNRLVRQGFMRKTFTLVLLQVRLAGFFECVCPWGFGPEVWVGWGGGWAVCGTLGVEGTHPPPSIQWVGQQARPPTGLPGWYCPSGARRLALLHGSWVWKGRGVGLRGGGGTAAHRLVPPRPAGTGR
jgi:hypothetical protein